LRAGAMSLQEFLLVSKTQQRSIIDGLSKCLLDYAEFLKSKPKYQALYHATLQSFNLEDTYTVPYFCQRDSASLKTLDLAIKEKPSVLVRDFSPLDWKQQYSYMQILKRSLDIYSLSNFHSWRQLPTYLESY